MDWVVLMGIAGAGVILVVLVMFLLGLPEDLEAVEEAMRDDVAAVLKAVDDATNKMAEGVTGVGERIQRLADLVASFSGGIPKADAESLLEQLRFEVEKTQGIAQTLEALGKDDPTAPPAPAPETPPDAPPVG